MAVRYSLLFQQDLYLKQKKTSAESKEEREKEEKSQCYARKAPIVVKPKLNSNDEDSKSIFPLKVCKNLRVNCWLLF